MQYVRRIETEKSGLVGFGVRTLLVSAAEDCGDLVTRISGLGTIVEVESDFFRAVEQIIDDHRVNNLCIVDCDSFGGLAMGHRFVQFLGKAIINLPLILMSREVGLHHFAQNFNEPTLLRVPLSPVAMRVGFEHSLRERFMLKAS